MNVTQLHPRRMTEEEYERERAALRATYGETSAEASAKRDQAMALLFDRSGWTQEELAKKEGKSQTWVNYRLRFGRFLNFITPVINADWVPKDLTEKRFREKYWEKTSGTNERQRFAEVQKLMAADLTLRQNPRPSIATPLMEQFADGKWHSLETIAKKLDTTDDHVKETLHNLKKGSHEHKKVGKGFHYRIFPKGEMISSSELATKLGPIIDQLRAEGKKHPAAASPGTVARLAHELTQLLEEWTK